MLGVQSFRRIIINDDIRAKEVRMIDDKFMKKYEESSPEFYAAYMSVKKKKKREQASHVLPLLKEWQLIQ